jgi:hypothetical protein
VLVLNELCFWRRWIKSKSTIRSIHFFIFYKKSLSQNLHTLRSSTIRNFKLPSLPLMNFSQPSWWYYLWYKIKKYKGWGGGGVKNHETHRDEAGTQKWYHNTNLLHVGLPQSSWQPFRSATHYTSSHMFWKFLEYQSSPLRVFYINNRNNFISG